VAVEWIPSKTAAIAISTAPATDSLYIAADEANLSTDSALFRQPPQIFDQIRTISLLRFKETFLN
jgi:hypothetical protein